MSITLWLFPGCLPSSNRHPHSFRQLAQPCHFWWLCLQPTFHIAAKIIWLKERFDHFLLLDQRGLPLCPGSGLHTLPSTWHYPPPRPNLPHGFTQHTMLSEREQNLTLAVSSGPEAYIAKQPWACYLTDMSFSFLLFKKGHSVREEWQTLSSKNLGTWQRGNIIPRVEQHVTTKCLAGFWGFIWMPEFTCALGKMFWS